MATLNIKTSDDTIQIPLSKTRQYLRNLACLINGETYYHPLIRAGEYATTNINIRCNNLDYALSFRITVPYMREVGGSWWSPTGSPTCDLSQADWLTLNGSAYIERHDSFALKASDSFTFETRVIPTTVNSAAHAIFELYNSSAARVSLIINNENKFTVGLNSSSSAIITCPTAVTKNTSYQLEFCYNNGTFRLYVDNSLVGSASKTITAGNYTPYIGYSKAKSGRYFIGRIHQPKLTGAAEFFLPFGDN